LEETYVSFSSTLKTTSDFSKTLLFISDTTHHNISVSFKVLYSHSDADEDSTLLEFTLCRMVNSCRHVKKHNASIFRVKQSKKIYSLFHGSIIFVLYLFEVVYNIGTTNAYCKYIYSVLQDACETLLKRLEPFKAANPKGKWADWVKAAYFERVSLSATGFYRWGELFTPRFKHAFKFVYSLEFFRSFCNVLGVVSKLHITVILLFSDCNNNNNNNNNNSFKSHKTNMYSYLLFSRTPGIGYDLSKNEGKPFRYFTYGAACSEVEIDCLTGDHQVTSHLISDHTVILNIMIMRLQILQNEL